MEKQLKKLVVSTFSKNQDKNLLSILEIIGRNAQAKGLTEEILEELLADES